MLDKLLTVKNAKLHFFPCDITFPLRNYTTEFRIYQLPYHILKPRLFTTAGSVFQAVVGSRISQDPLLSDLTSQLKGSVDSFWGLRVPVLTLDCISKNCWEFGKADWRHDFRNND